MTRLLPWEPWALTVTVIVSVELRAVPTSTTRTHAWI